ncbi:hypothetical protein DC007_14810, partial [Enterococcus faecalis]
IGIVTSLYLQYEGVSGLNININKSQVVCINTPPEIQQGFTEVGIEIVTNMPYLGVHIATTLDSTIENTFAAIQPKAIQRKILATSVPTDILHKATLIKSEIG